MNTKVYVVIRNTWDGEIYYGVFSSIEKAQQDINTQDELYRYEFEIREEELDDPDI
ncbi:MAG TPA: hypothetical protein VFM18_04905 [Methanosarcina sp.]|nr:hypothetical protein [Methanosarcina sp.]